MKITPDLLFRFFRNEQTSVEAAAIGEWIEQDPSHLEALNQAFRLFQEEQVMLEPAGRKVGRWKIAVAVLAVAASVLVGVMFERVFGTKPAMEKASTLLAQVAVQETMPGDRVQITLPDGSTVFLNSDSRLEYFSAYAGGERRVKLRGEALFQVKSDPDNPFVVETPAYGITATGTRFNVFADERRQEFSVALMEGTVSVYDLAGDTDFTLKPGQEVVCKDGKLQLGAQDNVEDATLWTKGLISISGVPFDKLMKTFERCYGVKIVIDRDRLPAVHYGLAKVRISNGIEYALNVLQKRSDFKYQYNDDTQTYHIY